jgi:hypothetical protein
MPLKGPVKMFLTTINGAAAIPAKGPFFFPKSFAASRPYRN